MSLLHICRLYLITPPMIAAPDKFAQTFEAALTAGDVACVQLRLKQSDGTPASDDIIMAMAEQLLPIAQRHNVAFVINDRPDLAKRAGADGVHIGQDDTSYAQARVLLGKEATIGVTCHSSRHLALEAAEAGADYVAFGAFFPTETKTPASFAERSILTWWQELTTVPCVAIGGITAKNCKPLITAGADFLAVSSAIWNHPEGVAAGVKAINHVIEHAAE